jgi:hypothetical protein
LGICRYDVFVVHYLLMLTDICFPNYVDVSKMFVISMVTNVCIFLCRYWEPLNPGEKLIIPSTIGYCGFLLELSHTTKKQKQKKGSPF